MSESIQTQGSTFRRIGKADVEHYEAGMVLTVARALPGRPYDQLAFGPRQRRLNAAVAVVQALMNDKSSRDRMEFWCRHASNTAVPN